MKEEERNDEFKRMHCIERMSCSTVVSRVASCSTTVVQKEYHLQYAV
jgi:hypothetical protein